VRIYRILQCRTIRGGIAMWSSSAAPRRTRPSPRGPKKFGLSYAAAGFKVDGEVHASEREALMYAARNPLDASHMAITFAGNDASGQGTAFGHAKRGKASGQMISDSEGFEPRRK
jgi:hypothetical protein